VISFNLVDLHLGKISLLNWHHLTLISASSYHRGTNVFISDEAISLADVNTSINDANDYAGNPIDNVSMYVMKQVTVVA
jgi:hypothetical protein